MIGWVIDEPVKIFEVSSDHIVGVEFDVTSIIFVVIFVICCLNDSVQCGLWKVTYYSLNICVRLLVLKLTQHQ